MVSANQFRKGLCLEHKHDVFEIIEFVHVKPGKGGAFVKVKLKSLTTQRTLEETVRPEDKFEDLFMEDKSFEFLYSAGDKYVFMDLVTYDQIELEKAQIKHILPYLKENMEVKAKVNESRLFGLSLPISVALKIVETAPNFKGDTSGGGKPATLETGAVITVPFFVANGETVKVDTRTNDYLGRV